MLTIAACTTNQPVPGATPTAANTQAPAATSTPRPQPTQIVVQPTAVPTTGPATPPQPTAFPFEETDVQYVMVKQDLEIHAGPGENYPVVGPLFAGNFAQVTGVNANETWWRVFCPNDAPGNCWISADPELTEPVALPGT